LPGRIDAAETSFASTADLASALRRAEAAHGEHEKRTGQRDANWPDRRVHGGGAGWDGTAVLTDARAIVQRRLLLIRATDNGSFEIARCHHGLLEDVTVGNPLEGLVEHFLRVGFEHNALAGAPAARVHHLVEA